MFFYVSKALGFFLQPLIFTFGLLILGLIFMRTRFKRLGKTSFVTSLLLFVGIFFTPLAFWILVPLEQRFPVPQPPAEIAGIIVLGGSIEIHLERPDARPELNGASDRIAEAVYLARNVYRDAPIIFSGGSNAILFKTRSEAEMAKAFFEGNGLSPSRLHYEAKSRNTWENATLSMPIADGLDQKNQTTGKPWLLITSAFHMPRSMGIFRKAGWENVVAWPVDFRTRGTRDYTRIPTVTKGAVDRMATATREWIGLIAYYFSGRTTALFPAP